MNTRNRIEARITPRIDKPGLQSETRTKQVTLLNEELQLDESDSCGGDPYNSAPTAPLEKKRNTRMP